MMRALIVAALLAVPRQDDRPNLVLIVADDLGWSDLGCYGADLHETPNLDRLAREGVRFLQAYAAAPVCTPTRAALMTGKHPARLHMTLWREGSLRGPGNRKLLEPRTVSDLPHVEVTAAEALKSAGYLTFHVGKWHLGDADHAPETQGFDVNVGGNHWGAPATYFHPFSGPFGAEKASRYVPGLGLGKPGQYLTDRLTDEALQLIERAGDRPFFLNLWYYAPHTPIEGKPAVAARFAKKIGPESRHRNAHYAAMIHSLDENVGRVLEKLAERGLAGRTLVLFTSDNGGYINEFKGMKVTDNHPLRSGKGSLYEGGIRVPLLARWPGVAIADSTCTTPAVSMDLFATLLEAAGVKAPVAADGLSLVPLLRTPQAELPRREFYFHYPHYYATTTPVCAVRAGAWKLLEYHEDGRLELYNLREDPGETLDLAGELPDRAADLKTRLQNWRRTVGAQMPTAR